MENCDNLSFLGIYEALPPGEYFRLLEISPGLEKDEILCELVVTSLEQAMDKYEAISYAWGDPTVTVDINCNGVQVPITINLADALRTFRHPTEKRVLWADALCINQQDVEERGSQVKQMALIFENAHTVLAWLGCDPSGVAEDCFKLITDTNAFLDELFLEQCNGANPLDMEPLGDFHQVCIDRERWTKVVEFFEISWFQRLWVVQEVAVAKKCDVYWGNQRIDVAHVYELATWVGRNYDFAGLLISIGIVLPVYHLVDLLDGVLSKYSTKKSWRSSLPLISWECLHYHKGLFIRTLAIGRKLKATDPLDHVYTFFGCPLARRKDGQPILDVSYTKSMSDVYFHTACALLQNESEAPWVLSAVDHHSSKNLTGCSDTPSWVPIWNKPQFGCSIASPFTWFRAGGCRESFSAKVRDDKSLEVSGCTFDKVAWTSEIINRNNTSLNPKNWDDNLCEAGKPLIDLLWESLLDVAHEEPSEDDFSITLVMGYTANDSKSSLNLQRHRESFASYQQHVRSEISNWRADTYQKSIVDSRAHQFAYHFSYCRNRRMILTEGGRLGIASSTTRVGDTCCIIFGAVVPFILTPVGTNTFKLAGECYIHDVMDGEIVELVELGKLEREVLVIV